MEIESRGWSDGQPGRGRQGREGQRTSPVSQGCAVKRLLNCWSSILKDKTCERGELSTDSGEGILGVYKTVVKVD